MVDAIVPEAVAVDVVAPEDIILGDRTLQVLGLAWAILFAAGTYAS